MKGGPYDRTVAEHASQEGPSHWMTGWKVLEARTEYRGGPVPLLPLHGMSSNNGKERLTGSWSINMMGGNEPIMYTSYDRTLCCQKWSQQPGV